RVKDQPIHDVIIDDKQPWRHKHFEALNKNYAKSVYWKDHKESLQQLYDRAGSRLIDLTIPMIHYIRAALGIRTEVVLESEMGGQFGTGSERIARICDELGAKVYLSGKGALAYNDVSLYE